MSVMRHRRTNATSSIVIVASSFVAQDPLVTAGESPRRAGIPSVDAWSFYHDVEQSFLRPDVSVGSGSAIRRLRLNVRFARKRTWLAIYEYTPCSIFGCTESSCPATRPDIHVLNAVEGKDVDGRVNPRHRFSDCAPGHDGE